MSILVVGVGEDNLGEALMESFSIRGVDVTSAGIDTICDVKMNVTQDQRVKEVFRDNDFSKVVYCAGINLPSFPAGTGFVSDISREMEVNYLGAMRVLHYWFKEVDLNSRGAFVGVSSNSAHIARSPSLGYCSSKAAMSMGIKVAARRSSKLYGWKTPSIWGIEPGWIEDTPMSKQFEAEHDEEQIPHRIPTGDGMLKGEIADFIAREMIYGGNLYHGQMIRLDRGEQ